MQIWREIATSNTKMYEEVFGGKLDPPSSCDTYKDLHKWKVLNLACMIHESLLQVFIIFMYRRRKLFMAEGAPYRR